MPRTKGRDSWRRKEWYDILAPPMFGSNKIGETLASDPEKVKGRVIETTLGDLIDDFSKSHIKISFKVKEVQNKQAKTEFVKHDMSREYIRGQVRRRSTKIECITNVKTSDNRELRVKAIAVTLNRTQNPQKKSIYNRMENHLKKQSKEYDFEQLTQQIVLGKLASGIYNQVKDVCPIRRVEIKKSKVID